MRKTVFLLLIIISFTVSAQVNDTLSCYIKDTKGRIREHNLDFIKLSLDVKFIPEQGKVTGIAEYDFKSLQQNADSVFLDGPGILIQNIQLDNADTRFRTDSNGITIYFNPALTWDTIHHLTISYSATPRKGMYFIGWNKPVTAKPDDPYRTRKQIWTQGQGIDNRNWIPSYDDVNDKLITNLTITFDKNYTVISNGNLVSSNANTDGTITWNYAMPQPHSLYLIMLAIGEYSYADYVSKNGVTSREYYYPDRTDAVATTYKYSAEIMDWLNNEIGINYPWGKIYRNIPVQEYIYGAMENTTSTIFTDYYLQNAQAATDKNYISVNAHELTHQWFGDYVTEFSGTSHWLHESFASYYSKKFREYTFGKDEYAWIRREEMNQAFSADVKNNLPIANSQAGSSRFYPKGSIVLDMLRYVTGDEQFRRVIKDYLSANAFQNVTNYDLQMQFMKTLGMNMDWFFDEWIYKGGFPEYTVQYISQNDTTIITVEQTQKTNETIGLFKMPVQFEVHYKDGSFDNVKQWVEKKQTVVKIPNKNKKEIAFVLFDPNSMIYAAVKFNKSYTELKYQAFNAPNMTDRYDAVTAMRETTIEKKRDDLIALYEKENFSQIKMEIIQQLLNDTDKKTLAVLKKALHDKNALVRREVIQNTKVIPGKLLADYEFLLNDSSYVTAEIALRKLCELKPENKQKYLDAAKDKIGMNKNIRIAWLEITYATDKENYIDELVSYTGYSYEFRTRINAMRALGAVNYCDKNTIDNLFDALVSSNSRLASPARNTLQFFMQTPQYNDLIKQVYNTSGLEGWQREKIASIFPKK